MAAQGQWEREEDLDWSYRRSVICPLWSSPFAYERFVHEQYVDRKLYAELLAVTSSSLAGAIFCMTLTGMT